MTKINLAVENKNVNSLETSKKKRTLKSTNKVYCIF